MKVGDLVKFKDPRNHGDPHRDQSGIIVEMEKHPTGTDFYVRVILAISQFSHWVERKQLEVINESR